MIVKVINPSHFFHIFFIQIIWIFQNIVDDPHFIFHISGRSIVANEPLQNVFHYAFLCFKVFQLLQ
jgi:hypothetical protein